MGYGIEFDIFHLADDMGPELIVYMSDINTGLKAILVVDNTAAGPAMGGIRMSPEVTTVEVARLARAMTLKNAMARLPYGGGKSGIIADPALPEKEALIRAFARKIRHIIEYIPGPDMGTSETEMAYIRDEIGRAVGLPGVVGGIPLDEIGSTGFGVAISAEIAAEFIDLDLKSARLTVEGFGAVGKHTARFLTRKGVVLIATSDSKGTIYNPGGLDVEELIKVKKSTGSVLNYRDGEKLHTSDLLNISTDIFVPAARPDVITESNADALDAKLVIEGANIPATLEAENQLFERGVLCVPDFVANAGGVITASVEYLGGTERQAFEKIELTIKNNTREVLELSRKEAITPRKAAESIARHRVSKAMTYRK
ncbi:MAG: Glu/Leu/Phe/Val dehydrogenase [Methanosarcinales archaeon]|nr:Glu/Leu/Phe/Val dehydrogenase [ANME-2 cluster archaeon]MDW7776565.1 Glu/Leu/Phe/Val dehydrogenase [Methanosarcinales archaeon]